MSAKDYIDNARRLADRASGLSLVLFAGLLVSVLSDFGPKLATFRDAAVAERAQSNQEPIRKATHFGPDTLEELRDVVARLTKQQEEIEKNLNSSKGSVSEASVEQLLRVRTSLENAKDNLAQTERAYRRTSETAAALSVVRDAQRRATEDVKLKGFGFELGVRGNWASVVWLFVFLLGMINLSLARFGFAGELRAGARDGEAVFEALRVPLWLHPIADSPLARASALVFFDTLTLAVVLLATACTAAAFWMARLTLAAPVFLAPGHEAQGAMASITIGCLIAGIVVTVSSWAIPVRLTDRAGDGAPRAVRRRLLVALPILAIGCSAVAVPAPLRRLLQQTLLTPRRRRRIRDAAIPSGFYAHKKTNKIHYVPPEGHARSLRGANMTNFVTVDPATLTAAHQPFVHVKALVPYSRQVVRNLGRDHDASAALLVAIVDARGRQTLPPAPATASTEQTQGPSEPGRDRTRDRKKGSSARSHGQHGRKSRNRHTERQQSRIDRSFQLLQTCDLLARLAARTRNRQHLEIALGYVRDLGFANGRSRNGSFAQRTEQIKDGVDSRLAAKKPFTLRRFESALRQLEESSERRKHVLELLQVLKSQSPVLDDDARLKQRASRRERVWSSPFWTSDYNRKARLIRHRGKRRRAKSVQA